MSPPEWNSYENHLEDLRSTLLRSLAFVGLGFFVAFLFHTPILHFLLENPYQTQSNSLKIEQLHTYQVTNTSSQDILFPLPSPSRKIVRDHPETSSSISLKPGASFVYEESFSPSLLITAPSQGIVAIFTICFWAGLALSAPFWGFSFLQFLLPGLLPGEKKLLIPFLFFSFFFTACSAWFAHTVSLPLATRSLFLINEQIGHNAWMMDEYLRYLLVLFVGHMIAAELVLILLFLVHCRIVSAQQLQKKRKAMIVICLIVGAILTPPDVLTQLLLAIPLILLYELSILYARWRRSRAPLFFHADTY